MASFSTKSPMPSDSEDGGCTPDQGTSNDELQRGMIHADEKLCDFILATVTSSLRLSIRYSNLDLKGSGLFALTDIAAGQEIFKSHPLATCVDQKNPNVCHYCLRDASSSVLQSGTIRDASDSVSRTKLCLGCKVARYCSKTCQQKAWKQHHKLECEILETKRELPAKHLILHRILLLHLQGRIHPSILKAIDNLETHFAEYTSTHAAGDLYEAAQSALELTKSRLPLCYPWRWLPMCLVNCIGVRHASQNVPIAYALDLGASMINHSCEPNAFIFFEGGELRVRSLQPIPAGSEITHSYIDPALDVLLRQETLQADHFFKCDCKRCRRELREREKLLGKGQEKLDLLRQTQKNMMNLTNAAAVALKYPGLSPDLEAPEKVDQKLRELCYKVFPSSSWPGYLDPLPSCQITLANIYMTKAKPAPALRAALYGCLLNRRRAGPGWNSDLFELAHILFIVASLPSDAPIFENQHFPRLSELFVIGVGLLVELREDAQFTFGEDTKYAAAVKAWCSEMSPMVQDPVPGTPDYVARFNFMQKKLLNWAGIDSAHAIHLTS